MAGNHNREDKYQQKNLYEYFKAVQKAQISCLTARSTAAAKTRSGKLTNLDHDCTVHADQSARGGHHP